MTGCTMRLALMRFTYCPRSSARVESDGVGAGAPCAVPATGRRMCPRMHACMRVGVAWCACKPWRLPYPSGGQVPRALGCKPILLAAAPCWSICMCVRACVRMCVRVRVCVSMHPCIPGWLAAACAQACTHLLVLVEPEAHGAHMLGGGLLRGSGAHGCSVGGRHARAAEEGGCSRWHRRPAGLSGHPCVEGEKVAAQKVAE